MGLCTLKYLLFFPAFLFAIANGNPGEPFLMNRGIIHDKPSCWSFRVGYMGDYVYKERFRDEFDIAGCVATTSKISLYTNAGLATFSLCKRVDFYGLVGASRIQIDEEAFSRTRLAWGVGIKAIIFRAGRFCLGADLKYFESTQKPLYFICEDQAYNIVGDYKLYYTETQGSAGVTYRTDYVAPYINVSYILSKLDPHPPVALVRLPTEDFDVDVASKSIINSNRWGFALGATLIDKRKATLSVEWRAINQNSIDVNGEIRF